MANTDLLIDKVSSILFDTTEIPDQERLKAIVSAQAVVLALSNAEEYTANEIDTATKAIQTRHDTRMGMGVLFDDKMREPWLDDRRGKINFYYWNRYHSLLKEKYSIDVVGKLDAITDKILDRLKDPENEGSWEKKGLVVGHVQSGKTANYIGLISKAADAGYKVIIVLGGMLNSLRNQTQARVDSDFMGFCTKNRTYLGVAKFGEKLRPISFTTSVEDFNKKTATNIAMGLDSVNRPIVLVVKKNVTTLRNVREWLTKNNKHNLQNFPLLLIDDEADHASINVNREDQNPTAINYGIRELLRLFPRNAYVGYTATPFANIFIDPENENQMTDGDLYIDLFPRNFILSLDPPNNYVGASEVFSDVSEGRYVREIDDNGDRLPIHHKKDFEPAELPGSMAKAIDCFIIAKAIRLVRGQKDRHHSMMINVSRFTDVQEKLKIKVADYLKKRQEAVKNYAGLKESEALKNTILRELKAVWVDEYSESAPAWCDVQCCLNDAVSSVSVISINLRSTDRLDYDEYPKGRSVIAIGGLGLSRGLTLEGLVVSYFLRNSIMYDTLLQMGRWFGYRDGYQDLCRVFLPREAESWYSHISDAVEELRGEFREMERLGLTPLEFGLKVRSHPAALIVTAKNKMRSAQEFVCQIALAGRFAETSRLINDDKVFADNSAVLEAAVKDSDSAAQPELTNLGWLWKGVPIEIVEGVVEDFKNAPDCLLTTKQPLLEHIAWLKTEKQTAFCDVLLRGKKDTGGLAIKVADRKIVPITRLLEDEDMNGSRLTFIKRHITSRGDEQAGISPDDVAAIQESYGGRNTPDKEYRKFKDKKAIPPLLILVFAEVSASKKNVGEKRRKNSDSKIVPAYGISFPGDPGEVRRPEKLVTYTVTKEWMKQNADWAVHQENEDDEE